MMATAMSTRASPAAFTARRSPIASRRVSVIRMAGGQGKGGEEGGAVFDKSVYGTVGKNANYMLLGSLLVKTGLDKVLMDPNAKYTLFAPSDDAFAAAAKKLGVTKLELANIPNLETVLKNHVVAGESTTSTWSEGGDITTVGGAVLKASPAGPSVNGVPLKKKDIKVTNGIIHAIETVLL